MTSASDIIEARAPTVDEYLRLRAATGLGAKSRDAAERGLANTWYGVTVRQLGEAIAMGRVIGDDGCFFQIVDIAVLPPHQRRGLGALVMEALIAELVRRAPKTAYVSLLADGEATRLYEKFGFRSSAPKSIGMFLKL